MQSHCPSALCKTGSSNASVGAHHPALMDRRVRFRVLLWVSVGSNGSGFAVKWHTSFSIRFFIKLSSREYPTRSSRDLFKPNGGFDMHSVGDTSRLVTLGTWSMAQRDESFLTRPPPNYVRRLQSPSALQRQRSSSSTRAHHVYQRAELSPILFRCWKRDER